MHTYFAMGLLLVISLVPTIARGQESPPVPDNAVQLMLIRNALTLVNHGNLTGNYTVLRDLASDRFRQRNTAADLAATFANLRQQKLDLSPVLVIQPQLTQPPAIAEGRLTLVGQFPTRPQGVQFALAFQPVGGGWMIDEVSLRISPNEPPASIYPAAAANPSPSAPAYRTAQRPATSAPGR